MNIDSKRVFASQAMGSPIYRGKSWFVATSIQWLSEKYTYFSLTFKGSEWYVGVEINPADPLYYEFYANSVEEVLADVVLSMQSYEKH